MLFVTVFIQNSSFHFKRALKKEGKITQTGQPTAVRVVVQSENEEKNIGDGQKKGALQIKSWGGVENVSFFINYVDI